jgi:hypothetical protein
MRKKKEEKVQEHAQQKRGIISMDLSGIHSQHKECHCPAAQRKENEQRKKESTERRPDSDIKKD